MKFSEREKIVPPKVAIQLQSIDSDLRNGLWNVMYESIFEGIRSDLYHYDERLVHLVKSLWAHHFKLPIDTIPGEWWNVLKLIRKNFFECEWYEVYDFMEFIVNHYATTGDQSKADMLTKYFNVVLKTELSGYRFVGKSLTKITSEEEIKTIEESLNKTSRIQTIYVHLSSALAKISDRKKPDYRNSIKESISAVEALCKIIASVESATLTQALREIEKSNKVQLHPSLRSAFEKLYGYTNDADGIRHALMEKPDLDFEDAKYFLISCTSFINYVIEKTHKAGIAIS